MKKTIIHLLLYTVIALILVSCTGIPEGIEPVDNFQINKYLGTWYEIARLDHSFERGLSNVTAQYSLRRDGGIDVVNRGFSPENQEWQVAEGKAYFVNTSDSGYLKVSFFGPFYGSYVIFELDEPGYQYSYVTGYNRDYLWLLARSPQVSDKILEDFFSTAETKGFDIGELILVKQEKRETPSKNEKGNNNGPF